ncbi:MAG: two-component regulator propeller domain-containing protein [Planctomycetota bacterium]
MLWVGTGNGIVRIQDGQVQADHDLPGADVWDVLIDRKGRMWVATLGGVFVKEGAEFKPFGLVGQDQQHSFDFAPHMVYDIHEARDGALWFGTDGCGVVRWDGAEQTAWTTGQGLASNAICKVFEAPGGDFWFGTADNGASHFDGGVFSTHLRNSEHTDYNGWGRIFGIAADGNGNVWFGRSSAGGGVWRYDGVDWQLLGVKDGLGDGGVIEVSSDRDGKVWVGTTAGVFWFDGRGFRNLKRPESIRS